MGRELKRVPLDFDWPVGEPWKGYLSEDEADPQYDPPKGEGWQLWENVSEGSPISPVFATADELIDWMSQPDPDCRPSSLWAQGFTRAGAEAFVRGGGYAPSFVVVDGRFVSGIDFMGEVKNGKETN